MNLRLQGPGGAEFDGPGASRKSSPSLSVEFSEVCGDVFTVAKNPGWSLSMDDER